MDQIEGERSLGGLGNHGLNPTFVDAFGSDGIPGNEDDNFQLGAGSPCRDAGDNGAVPAGVTLDLAGNPRVQNGTVDMGAFEAIPTECLADVANNDGIVNIDDLLVIINAWGSTGRPGGIDGDVIPDGMINIDDLLVILNGWGVCP